MNLRVSPKTSSMFVIPVITAIVFGTVLWSQATEAEFSSVAVDDGIKKAAIIDQLHDHIPNIYLQNEASRYLVDAGYLVDIYKTEDITIDFYKKLPTMDYDYIVFRTHALNGRTAEDSPKLYTNDKYTTDRYVNEQLLGIVDGALLNPRTTIQATIDVSDLNETNRVVASLRDTSNLIAFDATITSNNYFVIGAKAVETLMVGQFPGSTIILGGCDTLSNPQLAKSLIKRGASEVVGWDGTIDSVDNDAVMLSVLRKTLENDMILSEVIESEMDNFVQVPGNSASLEYYSEKTDQEI